MRKITEEACRAFYNGYYFNKDNTRVYRGDDGKMNMQLHGNLIAAYTERGIEIRDGGMMSNTTKERIRGILEERGRVRRELEDGTVVHCRLSLYTKKFVTYISYTYFTGFPVTKTVSEKVEWTGSPFLIDKRKHLLEILEEEAKEAEEKLKRELEGKIFTEEISSMEEELFNGEN